MKPKILFVDNERLFVSRHIEKLTEEYDVSFIANVRVAQEAMKCCESFSCLIIDVMMPVERELAATTHDGLDTGIWLIHQVESELKESKIPVILLTNRQESDVAKCLKSSSLPRGQILVKPKDGTSPKVLLELVRTQINSWLR